MESGRTSAYLVAGAAAAGTLGCLLSGSGSGSGASGAGGDDDDWDLPLLVRAAQRKPIERLPVWLMRQAGRYLPEYHERRKGPDGMTVDFFDAIRDAEMAADLTVQPVTRFGVDAAIVYSDILIIPQAMNSFEQRSSS